MSLCLIALGSNAGDRPRMLAEAITQLARHPEVKVAASSLWLETAPVGGPSGQASFLNGAAVLETSLAPEALLTVLQQIETGLGRRRETRWGPRTIDLDLLLYERLVQATPSLVLPHPRMAWRRFVLEPAAQIAAAMVHPTTGWTVGQLLEHLDTSPFYVAIAGSIGSGKTELARQVAGRWASGGRGRKGDPKGDSPIFAPQKSGQSPVGCHLLAGEANAPLGEGDSPIFSARKLGQSPKLDAFTRDPASHAWQIELEFVQRRAQRLAAARPEWQRKDVPTVSDFWFDQTAALARVWLTPEQWDVCRARWEQLRRGVVRPRLIVLLEATTEEWIEGSRSILEEAQRPGQGPLLRLCSRDSDGAVAEVLAAMESMSPTP